MSSKLNLLLRQSSMMMMNKQFHRSLHESIPEDLKKRYHFQTYEELCHRISNATPSIKQDLFNAMIQRKFSPAGNTLLAGIRSIRPNCSILPTVTDENLEEIKVRAINIWKHHTGIGFDLSGCQNPVQVLYELAQLNDSIKFDDRCQRGNMAVLTANHPQAIQFAQCKIENPEKIFNFNISIAFENDEQFENAYEQALNLKQGVLWATAQSAWKCGCPGIVFLNRFREASCEKELSSVDSTIEPICTTVPCGEQGMRPNESCNLGVINLFAHIDQQTNLIDLDQLRSTVRLAVTFLDLIVDQIEIDDPQMQQRTQQLRRIGLGVTGLADCLHKAQFNYNSNEALTYANSLASTIAIQANQQTEFLANQLGRFHPLIDRRNITVTCCQPTGNITRLLQTKGFAIEPFMEQATNISPIDHLNMQLVWQKHFENAVSKTVNLPSSTTIEDILQIFSYSYQTRILKGVAVYRDYSRDQQPITLTTRKHCNQADSICSL